MLDYGFYNMDCMKGMKEFPDKFFDLAIVDPPYGIGVGSMAYTNGVKRVGRALANRKDYRCNEWDIKPDKEYFDELMRVSKKQIVWGGNYFSDMLKPSKGFIVWDKRCAENMSNDFADCEYAWLSDGMGVARMFRYVWNGMLQGDMKHKEVRFHPTQKPVALYRWLIEKYMPDEGVMLDTHVGSASSLIACHETGHKYVGFEIDKDYYAKAKKRLDAAKSQVNIFDLI